MTKQIGFFGGTFDPIHFGHMNLAINALEKGQLDEIIFCPTNLSPFKIDSPPEVDAQKRYEMIELSIKDINKFSLIDFEIKKSKTYYTIDTLKYIYSIRKDEDVSPIHSIYVDYTFSFKCSGR